MDEIHACRVKTFIVLVLLSHNHERAVQRGSLLTFYSLCSVGETVTGKFFGNYNFLPITNSLNSLKSKHQEQLHLQTQEYLKSQKPANNNKNTRNPYEFNLYYKGLQYQKGDTTY